MSSISSVSGSSLTWLQRLQAQQQAQQNSAAANAAATDSTDSTDGTPTTAATTPTATTGTHHGHHGGGHKKFDSALEDQGITGTKLSDLRGKLQDAVTSAKSDGTDPKEAVDTVLKDAGVDLDAFKKDIGSKGAGGPPSSDAGADSTAASTSATTTPTPSAIDAALQKSGIDPTTFKTSLLSFLDPSNPSDSSDLSSLFANAQTGSEIDIAA